MEVFHHSCFAMGTRFNCVIPEMNEQQGEKTALEINRILSAEEALLSSFVAHSEVSRINTQAVNGFVRVSVEMAEVIDLLNEYWIQTGGSFDAGLLCLTQSLKNQQGIPFCDKPFGWQQVEWNHGKREIRFLNDAVGIDVGGFGKGWAVQKIIRYLKDIAVQAAFISFGESTIAVIGRHPLGNHWPVSIKHPESGVELKLKLVDESISVSGLANITSDGENSQMPHIIRPHNGTAVGKNSMAVVKCASPVDAEVLSTAILASPDGGVNQILEGYPTASIYLCEVGGFEFKKLKIK
jgi:thiamine biosynthesis lipoprotein